jgi:hypothetical protein
MSNRFSVVDREVPYLHEKQIEQEARVLLEEYEIKFGYKPTAPIPIERIAEIQLQLTLEFKDMKSLFPFADVHGAIWFDEGIIGIDQSLDPDINPPMLGRYHFTLAHEIGHWCLHRQLYKDNPNQLRLFDDGSRQPDVVCRSSERKKPVEWQADAFAASLLMPRSLVYEAWMEHHNGDDQEAEMATLRPAYADKTLYLRGRLASTPAERDITIKEDYAAPFAERFSVSKEAMRIRLEELELFVENRPQLLF